MSNKNVSIGQRLTLLLCGVCTVASGALIAPILPDVVVSTGSEVLTPYAMLLPNLAMMLFAPFIGRLLDIYGRLIFMRIGLLGYALLGSAGYFFVDNIYLLLSLRFVFGVFTALNMTAISTLVADYFSKDPEGRAKFSGYQGTFASLSAVIVIQFGTFMAKIDFRYTFLMYLIGIVFLVLTLVFLHEPIREETKGSRVNPNERTSFLNGDVILIFITLGLGMAIYYAAMVYTPFIIHKYTTSASAAGIAINLVTGLSAISAFFYGKIKSSRSFDFIYMLCFSLIFLGYIFIGMSDNLTFLYVGCVISGLGVGLLMPNSAVRLMTSVNPHVMGAAMGILIAVVFGGNFSAGLLAAPILPRIGYSGLFLVFGSMGALIALFYGIKSLNGSKIEK
ncbi:MFS transporter [Vibrio mediterranei]|uniref:MFS transporter n=1 Tax=Vibrio mediterranei TaxID=689 RepID=UPI001EFDCBFA|nr:MFS transporter [Vibrio mediterranei]MCG9627478.1 MFS transporter [Vibrio mediterranei]